MGLDKSDKQMVRTLRQGGPWRASVVPALTLDARSQEWGPSVPSRCSLEPPGGRSLKASIEIYPYVKNFCLRTVPDHVT